MLLKSSTAYTELDSKVFKQLDNEYLNNDCGKVKTGKKVCDPNKDYCSSEGDIIDKISTTAGHHEKKSISTHEEGISAIVQQHTRN